MIDILLADDQSIVRNGIRILLEKENDFRIVAETGKMTDIPDLLLNKTPHILIVDIDRLQISSAEISQFLQSGNLKVILLTINDQFRSIDNAFKAGISAYLLKSIGNKELVFAVRQVIKGAKYLSNGLSLKLLDESLSYDRTFDAFKDQLAEFSEREVDILKLMADGFTNGEIADKMFISKRTVEGYRRAMIRSAGVKNTATLIKYAIKRKIID